MSSVVNARIPAHIEQKLAEYCTKRGVARALEQYFGAAAGGVSAWTLAVDLVPKKGIDSLQSNKARALARKAMRNRIR